MAQANQYFAPTIHGAIPAMQEMQDYNTRNTLAQQQNILFQQAQQEHKQAQEKDTLFKNALVNFLGPVNAGMVTGEAGLSPQGGQPSAVPMGGAPDGGMNGNAAPEPNPQDQQQNALVQMLQNDPERAAKFIQFQQEQQQAALAQQQAQRAAQQAAMQQQAKQKVLQADYYLQSSNPGRTIEMADPEAYQNMVGHGIDMTDPDAVREALGQVKAHFGPIAGMEPLEATLEGQKFAEEKRKNLADEKLKERELTIKSNKELAAEDSGLAPEDIDVAAGIVMLDPTRMHDYATFGKAGQAIRTQINKAITKKLTDANMTTGGLAKLRSNFVAQKGSVKKMTEQSNNIETFEGLAKANGQRVLDLIDKIDDTGVPFIEGITRRAKKGAGDVDTAEAQSVLTSFQTEAARIINNPNMTGVLSDSARHEVQEMISGNLSAAQTKRVINRLFTEMDIRKQLINQQLGTATSSMVGETPVAGASAAPAGLPPDIAALLAKHGGK